MTLLLELLGLLLLVGCTQFQRLTGDAGGTLPVILLAGQSNMVRFAQYAEGAFAVAYGPAEFLPCAVGGTESSQWLPGGPLFQGCIDAAAGRHVDAILYWQGESDAYNERTSWGANFIATIEGLRSHFGAVPVVFAQIAITTDPNFARGWASIQAQQAAVQLSNAAMIRTDDLAQLADEVHLTPDSLRLIASRFAAALNALEGRERKAAA